MKHIELIQDINILLQAGKEHSQPAKDLIKRFKELLPRIDSHFRIRKPRISDRISDEYYDEFRTPLAQMRLQTLRSILADAEENPEQGT